MDPLGRHRSFLSLLLGLRQGVEDEHDEGRARGRFGARANKPAWLKHRTGWIVALVSLLSLALLTGCRPPETRLPQFKTVGDFTLVDQNGQPFSRQALEGKIWVADFFFAGCATECIALSYRMNKIQRLLEADTNVVLVSFTVDPRSDTPKALRRYAERFGALPDKWFFLTGDKEVIYRTITDSFLLPVAESPEERLQLKGGFIHSNKIAVVDATGTVRAYFDGLVLSTPEAVQRAVRTLQEESPSPPAPSQPPKA